MALPARRYPGKQGALCWSDRAGGAAWPAEGLDEPVTEAGGSYS